MPPASSSSNGVEKSDILSAEQKMGYSALSVAQQFFLITAAGLTSGVVLNYLQNRSIMGVYSLSDFVDPEGVADIASDMPSDEGEFTLEAWDYVGGDIDYSGYGSIITFYDSTINCQRCLLPERVISTGVANCVGKSALLTSILRNRYSPERVYMVIGEYMRDGEKHGHAWVEVNRGGTWYVIEATLPPPVSPWAPVSGQSSVYSADIFFNDFGVLCYDEEMCPSTRLVIKKRPCLTCHL